MLLATSSDKIAYIWKISSGATCPTSLVMLKGHTEGVNGGAFLGDESHVITGSPDNSLRIWRTSDGVQTAIYPYCVGQVCHALLLLSLTHFAMQVTSLSYHAESGNIVVGLRDGQVELFQTDPYKKISTAPKAAPPTHACVRERLAEAQAQVKDVEASLEKADVGLRQQMSREQELKRSIADLEAKCAHIFSCLHNNNVCLVTSEKTELEQLQTAEYTTESRAYIQLVELRESLLGIINKCTQTLDSLTDCLSVSGLEDVRGDAFNEWLCDIGLGKLKTALHDVDGPTLTMLHVDSVMDYKVTFDDAAALQLRAYMAHYKLSDDSAFTPPSDSVLSWTVEQTANWIESLGAPYSRLAFAGWHGAALCSLLPPRVLKASEGALKASDAVKFIGFVRKLRAETDGDKATWVSKWSGVNTIEGHAI